jgi:drug/metabolite transporter (DMT)-like permease
LFKASLKLFLGATAIGFAPIFAKLLIVDGGVSPIGSGFWRMFIGSLGFLILVLANRDQRKAKGEVVRLLRDSAGSALMAGLLFAGDLMAWHTSFLYTSVGASSLIANLSAILVPLAGVLFFKETLQVNVVLGGALAFSGLGGLTFLKPEHLQAAHDSWRFLGEGLAFMTAFFYTGYMISIKTLAGRYSSRMLMLISSCVSALALGAVAILLREPILPNHEVGWLWAICVGLISQVIGQGLVASSLAVLPVGQSAILLLWAPISTAIFGWLIFNEAMSTGQIWSMLLMVFGIGIVARR